MIGRIIAKLKFMYLKLRIHHFDEFRERHAGFEDGKELVGTVREKLRPAYELYVREVSVPDMAASLEASTLLYRLCQANKYKRLLDLGSGFSSFVFRLYAKETPGVKVISVDDDSQWLLKTRNFLEAQNVPLEGMMMLDAFLSSEESEFDCIFHDLNFVEVRINYVSELLARLKPGGLLILDDVHKREYLMVVLERLTRQSGVLYDLKPMTLDQFGRYAIVFKRTD